jgi:hypothetical protein
MKSVIELLGFEYDWLACDQAGRVALFSTAGACHAPRGFRRDVELHSRAIEALLALPPTTGGICDVVLEPGMRNDWEQVMLRGVYAFDGDVQGGDFNRVNGGDYVRCAVPNVPASLQALPEIVRFAAWTVPLTRLNFDSVVRIAARGLPG